MDPWRPKYKRLYDALTAAVQFAQLVAFVAVILAVCIWSL